MELAKKEARSSIRLAAISRWAAEDPGKALEYYTKNKDDLSGKDHVTATAFVRAARVDQNAKTYAARIVGGGHPDLYERVIQAESSGVTTAQSKDGASGLMQIMPDTARETWVKMGRTDLAGLSDEEVKAKLKSDPTLDKQTGQRYLNDQLTRFNGDVEAALVAYNAGPRLPRSFFELTPVTPPAIVPMN